MAIQTTATNMARLELGGTTYPWMVKLAEKMAASAGGQTIFTREASPGTKGNAKTVQVAYILHGNKQDCATVAGNIQAKLAEMTAEALVVAKEYANKNEGPAQWMKSGPEHPTNYAKEQMLKRVNAMK